MIKRISAGLMVAGSMAVLLLQAAPAQAQATRTWVSGVGDDVNPCSRTAPCKTFAGAISKTAVNGEINCLDPGGFGTVTITKSITIDCRNTQGSILNSGINGVSIPFDNFTAAGEVRKTVRLRGLTLNGANTGTAGVNITGGAAATGTEVFIEDSVIDGNFAGNMRGISDTRSGGAKLFVSNTTIRNLGGTGILTGSVSLPLDIILDNVRIENVQSGAQFSTGSRAMVSRSVISGNVADGVYAENGAQVNISDSTISHNAQGIANGANTATIRISSTDVAFNATGISGTVLSHVNNRITGNTSAGTVPTAISPAFQ